jgi:hypothetical protein
MQHKDYSRYACCQCRCCCYHSAAAAAAELLCACTVPTCTRAGIPHSIEQSVTLLPVLIAVHASVDVKQQQSYRGTLELASVAARVMQCIGVYCKDGCMYWLLYT